MDSLTKQQVLGSTAKKCQKRGPKKGQKSVKKGLTNPKKPKTKSRGKLARSPLWECISRLPVSSLEGGAYGTIFGKNFTAKLLIYCLVYDPFFGVLDPLFWGFRPLFWGFRPLFWGFRPLFWGSDPSLGRYLRIGPLKQPFWGLLGPLIGVVGLCVELQ